MEKNCLPREVYFRPKEKTHREIAKITIAL